MVNRGCRAGNCDHVVVWSYPLAPAGQDIRAACAKGGLIARILEAAAAKDGDRGQERAIGARRPRTARR